MGVSLPPPGSRAGTSADSSSLSQESQSGHHEPGWSSALAIQLSRLPTGGPPVQKLYFGLPGGLITPAIWPEPASTYLTGPPKNFDPRKADFAGAMWSSRVARL